MGCGGGTGVIIGAAVGSQLPETNLLPARGGSEPHVLNGLGRSGS